ncbi:transcriptional regulator family: Fungal Specific TF [Penicillium macrosclerotiorum]|uniref:transcriptional regulator family: Fungal Specific TF n=1 Tax=Penicillium macrosclerotiorum TaxID=303699 RepID=UPI00254966AE|nr:transcriptional regulator family: Fungal Specific TF [Penicillium macrosclerotiorum]KAJ5679073.1 transcriptional regulator family: Fungal Specific TF [Penicillium macrosclerotiorum]
MVGFFWSPQFVESGAANSRPSGQFPNPAFSPFRIVEQKHRDTLSTRAARAYHSIFGNQMQSEDLVHVLPAPIGKKRIPKACSACRQSKVRCDGDRPCGRCQKFDKQCIIFETPKDPVSERLEGVECEVQYLRQQLDDMRDLLQKHHASPSVSSHNISPRQIRDHPRRTSACSSLCSQFSRPPNHVSAVAISDPARYLNGDNPTYQQSVPGVSPNQISVSSIYEPSNGNILRPSKRKRSCFEIRDESIADFIEKGLITLDCAVSFFNTFFQGCDRYIPIFDPDHDTFESVRARSSILLNAICTIGCMVETRSGGPTSDMLHAELKKWINVIIQNKRLNCLESVQAMLVVACYSSERLLILSFATRMALDLGLHEAFEELTERLATNNDEDSYGVPDHDLEKERILMRKSRTWFGLLVLEHIFRVDGGKPPGIRLIGNSRRCRILLSNPSSTILDLRLFSQVELNILRATINDTLGGGTNPDRGAISDFVHEMKIDIDLWFDDWLRIIEGCIAAQQEKPFLLVALRVQKCWAEMMLNCKALRAMGVENVATMSNTEREILLTAKASARRHLRLIIVEPDLYLAKLKYAMDFVWAKCAFSYLLLLKFSRLLPERDEEHQELLEHGNRLVHELNKAGSNINQSGAGNIYLQILNVSIEKYGRALRESQQPNTGGSSGTSPFWELFDAQADLQWFVPEQFVSEWDFPGLNLFYFPTAWQDFFGDFSLAM